MDKPIIFEVRYTPEDALRAARYVQNRSFVYRNDALLTAVFVFLGFALLIFLLSDDMESINPSGFAAFTLLPAVLAGLLVHLYRRKIGPWFAGRRVKKYYDSSPLLKQSKQVEISRDGIKTTDELGSSFLTWTAFAKVVESPTDLMIYLGDETFPGFFPLKAIDSNDRDLLRRYIRDALGDRAFLQ